MVERLRGWERRWPMRMSGIAWIAIGLISLPVSAADSVAWGSTINGMRLGIDFSSASPEPELRVFLRNAGLATREVLIGHQTGKGLAVNLQFTAKAPDGKEREGFEINSFTPIAGLILPSVLRLDPG